MSYMAGSDGSLAKLGVPAGPPRVICDGCGKTESALKNYGAPKAWILNQKKVPGWFKMVRHEFTREDYCSEACYKRATYAVET